METILVWWLVMGGGGYHTTPLDKFATQADCKAAVAQLEALSADKGGMTYSKGICIPAKVLK